MSQKISREVVRRVRVAAGHRCGYCLVPQRLLNSVLEIEHLRPRAHGGTDDEENLWLSCRACNSGKGQQTHARDSVTRRRVALFNPRRQRWPRHFAWSADGSQILGRTACGRATVIALNMNHELAVTARQMWVSAGWHPPPA